MKIVFFTDSFYPNIDGVVTTIVDTSLELARLGHKILIIAPDYKNNPKDNFHKNIQVIRLKSVRLPKYKDYRFVYPYYQKCLKEIKKFNPDIIHLQTFGTLGILSVIISKKLKVPLIGTFHTFFTDSEYLKHMNLNFNMTRKVAIKYANFLYGQCQILTCPSESAKLKLLNLKMKSHIIVIPNGVNLPFDKFKIKEKRKKNKIIFIGRIAHEKNIKFLLDSFKIVSSKVKDSKLFIIGDGPQKKDLENYILKNRLFGKAIMVGSINHELLWKSELLKDADLFTTASLTETQGISTLEAQAMGIPCIALDASGSRDIIKDGYNGYLVKNYNPEDFAKKIIKILSDRKLLKKMSINSVTYAKKHNLKSITHRWEKVYQDLLVKRK